MAAQNKAIKTNYIKAKIDNVLQNNEFDYMIPKTKRLIT